MLRTLFILLGALGVGDTLVVSAYSNMNFGTVLPLILGAPLLLIGIFSGRLQRSSAPPYLAHGLSGLWSPHILPFLRL